MAIPSFFKTKKPHSFKYQPRYYDPVEEELKQRRKEREVETGETTDETPSLLRSGAMRRKYDQTRKVSSSSKSQNIRTLIILLIIVLLLLYMFW